MTSNNELLNWINENIESYVVYDFSVFSELKNKCEMIEELKKIEANTLSAGLSSNEGIDFTVDFEKNSERRMIMQEELNDFCIKHGIVLASKNNRQR